MTDPDYFTENMTLVAFLATRRVRHEGMELRQGTAVVWRYAMNGDLAVTLEHFERRSAMVEPVTFHRALTKVRREMNTLLRR